MTYSATKVSPADMIYNRKIQYSILDHGITVDTQLNEKANENDKMAKAKKNVMPRCSTKFNVTDNNTYWLNGKFNKLTP